LWQASTKSLAIFWETQGALWHGYEIIGLENIPDTGPALVIFYHAAMPIDFYYVLSKSVLYKNRQMKIVADRFLFKVPGLGTLLEALDVTPGSQDHCVELLKQGHILGISPGGVREALFSDHNYEIIWGSRVGFSKVAKEAKVVSVHPFLTFDIILVPFLYLNIFLFNFSQANHTDVHSELKGSHSSISVF
jgi:1-acyl-sn-glycerol-3-phosphate acyltransferase